MAVAKVALKYWYRRAPFVDMSGKVVVVTGANTGIGFETAQALLHMGATVIIGCRDKQRAQEATRRLLALKGKSTGELVTIPLDLASTQSIRQFAVEFKKLRLPLHVLINNAGVMFCEYGSKTADGVEMQFGVNHLGHFLLTRELFDVIKETPQARIINVSSAGHFGVFPPFSVDWNMYANDSYLARLSRWQGYFHSKLANVLFTRELHRRLAQSGSEQRILTCAVHPGAVKTELPRYSWIVGFLYHLMIFGKNPEEGAQTTIYCAVSPNVTQGGHYYNNCAEAWSSPLSKNTQSARQLWEVSEKILGVSFDVDNKRA